MRADAPAGVTFLEYEAALVPVAGEGAAELLFDGFPVKRPYGTRMDTKRAVRRAYFVSGNRVALGLRIQQYSSYLYHVAESLVNEQRVFAEASEACKVGGMSQGQHGLPV